LDLWKALSKLPYMFLEGVFSSSMLTKRVCAVGPWYSVQILVEGKNGTTSVRVVEKFMNVLKKAG